MLNSSFNIRDRLLKAQLIVANFGESWQEQTKNEEKLFADV